MPISLFNREVSLHAYRALLPLLCCYILLLLLQQAVLLLPAAPAAVRHRLPDGQIWCWFIESDPSVFLLFIQTRFIVDVPLGSTCVAFAVSICLRPRKLQACAEPRRASSRRGEPPSIFIFHYYFTINIAITILTILLHYLC